MSLIPNPPPPPNVDVQQSTVGNVIDWLGDNAQQVDAQTVEQRFKTEFPILLQDETVELAFRSGRDTIAFTSRRVLFVDVKVKDMKIVLEGFLVY